MRRQPNAGSCVVAALVYTASPPTISSGEVLLECVDAALLHHFHLVWGKREEEAKHG